MTYEITFEMVDWLPFLILSLDGKEINRHICLTVEQAKFVESYYYLIEEQAKLARHPFWDAQELAAAVLYLSNKYNEWLLQSS